MELSLEQIMRFIPHRKPFLFLDSIESITLPPVVKYLSASESPKEVFERKYLEGTIIWANFTIKEDMEILAGHFPGNPIVPGVVQIEMMAQASCFNIYKLLRD